MKLYLILEDNDEPKIGDMLWFRGAWLPITEVEIALIGLLPDKFPIVREHKNHE